MRRTGSRGSFWTRSTWSGGQADPSPRGRGTRSPSPSIFPPTSIAAVDDVEYAEYGQRVRAAILDGVIVYVTSGILIFGLSLFAFRTAGSPLAALFSTVALVIAYAGPTLYYTVCYAEGGQTLGKM